MQQDNKPVPDFQTSEPPETPTPTPSPYQPDQAPTPPLAPVESSTPASPSGSTFQPQQAVTPTAMGSVPSATSGAVPTTATAAYGAGESFNEATPKPKRKKLIKSAIIAGVALLLIGGGSAAAYFGYVVPNKPENILAEALKNTMQQKQLHTDGVITVDADGISMKVQSKTQTDLAQHVASGEATMTISGIDFSVEYRYIDDNFYFKVGDLSTIKSLLTLYAGLQSEETAAINSLIDTVSKSLANQWILVDSTLIKQSGADCALNSDTIFTDADIKLLQDRYKKDPFAVVKSKGPEDVNGISAEKYDISIDDDKATKYVESLRDLSIVKKLEECSGEDTPLNTEFTEQNGNTSVTIWVDKAAKKVVKVGLDAPITDTESGEDGTMTANILLKYDAVSVTAPENAKPVLQVFSELQAVLAKEFPELGALLDDSGSTDLPESDDEVLFN